MTVCPAEQQTQHDLSPGLVADAEDVCRGAYKPNHTNATGAKSAMIKVGDLAKGELSVWRLGRDPAFDANAVAAQIEQGPPGGTLHQILAASVKAIRSAQVRHDNIPEGHRIFCVLDDCRTDNEGGAHPEHATVSLEPIAGVDWMAPNAPETLAAKEALFALLKRRVVWPIP
jgi:hypothetical protein